jgi:hypothetical protein
MRNVTIDTNAGFAQFTAIPGPQGAPPLRISTRGPDGYRGTSVRVSGGYRNTAPQTAAIQPPRRALIGEVCVRNVGRVAVSLVGTTEKRTSGREQTVIDGRPVKADVQLQLLENRERTLLEEAPQTLQHMATFKGPFVTVGLLWVLLLLVVLGVPALVTAAVASALSTDQPARYARRTAGDPPSARQ